MNMTKTKAILFVAFLLAFAAGTSLGVFVAKPAEHHKERPSWLTRELNLTPEQQSEMSAIWKEYMESFPRQQQGERRAALAQQRDQDILALLSAEQRAKYDAIQQDYTHKVEELSQERKRAFDDVIAKTKAILTPAQATKYEELMKRPHERGMGMGGPGFRGGRNRQSSSTSRPTTDEQRAPRGGE
jgi:Spy/CpxP family protein refolding chaperone